VKTSNYQRYLSPGEEFGETEWSTAKQKALEDPEHNYLIELFGDAVWLELLQWDTDVLGILSARINTFFAFRDNWLREDLCQLIIKTHDFLQAKGIKFSSCRICSDDWVLADILMENGWVPRDMLNVYISPDISNNEACCDNTETLDKVEVIRYINDEEFAGCFSSARLHRDPRIDTSLATTFYRKLFNNILSRLDSVLVGVRLRGQLAGMAIGAEDIALSKMVGRKISYLWQIAVFKEFRGLGLSLKLLNGFLAHMRDVDVIEIGTQFDHVPANRLYLRAGLHLTANAITFHKWFD
jgi:GNAT superfamily N-acetyltransferase